MKNEYLTRKEFKMHAEEDNRQFNKINEKLDTLILFFENIKFGKSAFLVLLGIVATIVGILMGIKNFFK